MKKQMKKRVWISIVSTQRFSGCDEEHIDLMTEALLYERGGKYYITYDESRLTGLEGTKTTVKLCGKSVTLIRTGTFPAHMMFDEGQRHVGLYPTPVGTDMAITTRTKSVTNTVGENGGEVAIAYSVQVDGGLSGEHRFGMRVSLEPPAVLPRKGR